MRDGRVVAAYTTAEGLPHNVARQLFTDRAGTMWVGTDGGLSRFDGHSFTTFTTRDGLSDNTIQSMAEDAEGNLWGAR